MIARDGGRGGAEVLTARSLGLNSWRLTLVVVSTGFAGSGWQAMEKSAEAKGKRQNNQRKKLPGRVSEESATKWSGW